MSGLTPATNLALMQINQGNAANAADKLSAAQLKNAKDLEKVEAAAKDFEAVFVAEMMKPMFAGISTEAPFGGGKGEEVFRGMIIQEFGKMIAETGSIGVSDQVKTEMIRMQAAQNQ